MSPPPVERSYIKCPKGGYFERKGYPPEEAGKASDGENAIKKMCKGETTYQEVIRVTWGQI